MVRELQPPTMHDPNLAMFLAGGVTGCPDWQAEVVAALADAPGTLFNPRRPSFDVNDQGMALEQMAWEYAHLQRADAILFWFPASGPVPQPIALFELGAWLGARKPLFVGADPDYIRRADVLMQVEMARPDLVVQDTLSAVIQRARQFLIAGW